MESLFVDSDKLKEKYVFLRGCEIFVPKGWEAIINEFCEKVQELCQSYRSQGYVVYCRVQQIKEKFAGLRIYWGNLGQIKHDHRKSSVDNEKTQMFHTQLLELKSKYTDMADNVCQWCGNKGKLDSTGGWYQMICSECLLKQK